MKKMKLNIDQLKVDSFETDEKKNLKGTVNGNAISDRIIHTECCKISYVLECETWEEPCDTWENTCYGHDTCDQQECTFGPMCN